MNLEEIKGAIADNNELKDGLLEMFRGQGYKVYDGEAYTSLEDNLKQTGINSRTSAMAIEIEEILKGFGVEKQPNEKWFDMVTRGITEKNQSITDLTGKIDTSKNESERVGLLEKQILDERRLKEEGIAAAKLENEDFQKASLLEEAYKKLNFGDTGSYKDAFDALREKKMTALLSKSRVENGVLEFYENDQIMRNTDNLNNPYTPVEILKKEFAGYLNNGVSANGTGQGQPQGTTPTKPDSLDGKMRMAAPKDMDQMNAVLQDHFGKIGVPNGSKDYVEAFSKYRKELIPA